MQSGVGWGGKGECKKWVSRSRHWTGETARERMEGESGRGMEEEDKKKRTGRERKRERKHDILGMRESVACQTSPGASLCFFKYPHSALINMKYMTGFYSLLDHLTILK